MNNKFYNITFENITEYYDLGDDTNTLYDTDDTNMHKNWLQTLQIIEEKKQETKIQEKENKIIKQQNILLKSDTVYVNINQMANIQVDLKPNHIFLDLKTTLLSE